MGVAPLTDEEINDLLADYRVELSPPRLAQVRTYLDLLDHWNRRLNLTGIRTQEERVQRLFGESFFLADVLEMRGWLVDIGSGAGFPGLALKIVAPDLRVTLVESRQKKCTFLKEVARTLQYDNVSVVGERFESWAKGLEGSQRPAIITTRAVKLQPKLLALIWDRLAPQGKALFTTTRALAERIHQTAPDWRWYAKLKIPNCGEADVVLVGGRE